jgi:methyltransferase family protein
MMAALNHAARYFPILNELRKHLPPNGNVVEIGSGSIGIGEFWSRPFVGCDLSFVGAPRVPLLPVICSADALPFRNQQFDALVASDVLEHIPPIQRSRVVSEIFRVTRTVAIIGYPCGPHAWALDRDLHSYYRRRNLQAPQWLQEHMANPFPDDTLFLDAPSGWKKKVIPNENLRFHFWMMRAETYRVWAHSFRLALSLAPGLVRRLLLRANAAPYYRQIFVFTRV